MNIFRILLRKKATTFPPHPANTEPSGVPAQARGLLDMLPIAGKSHLKDVRKSPLRLYRLTTVEDSPLRLILDLDAIEAARSQRKAILRGRLGRLRGMVGRIAEIVLHYIPAQWN